LKSAIRSSRPTVLLEDRSLFESREKVTSDEDATLPLSQAEVVREGDTATVVAWGAAVKWAEDAAARLHDDGHRLEVIDLRSLSPIDVKTTGESCVKTGRVFIIEPTLASCSVGADLACRIQELCFDYLDAPIGRLNVDESIGYSGTLETSCIPSVDDVVTHLNRWLLS